MSDHNTAQQGDADIEALLREVGPRERPDNEMAALIHDVVHAEWLKTVQRRRVRRRWSVFAAAASVVAVVGAALFAIKGRDEIVPELVAHVDRLAVGGDQIDSTGKVRALRAGAEIHSGDSLRTSAQERIALQITPDLAVRVDQNSELQFAAPGRLVLLRGAVYVDAGPGPSHRSLIVDTPFGKLQHVGTQYETRLVAGKLRVRVREGEVRIEGDSATASAMAGEQLIISDGGVARQRIPIFGDEWDWVSNVAATFNIERRSLAEFLAWVARETGCEVVYVSEVARDSARKVILHGSVADLSPDSALAAVFATTRFTYTQNENRIMVTLKPS